MAKRKAIGRDPLSWIGQQEGPQTKTEIERLPGKPGRQSPLRKPSKPVTKRQTYHLNSKLIQKVKSYAYWERLKISEVINLALEDFFKDKKVEDIPSK